MEYGRKERVSERGEKRKERKGRSKKGRILRNKKNGNVKEEKGVLEKGRVSKRGEHEPEGGEGNKKNNKGRRKLCTVKERREGKERNTV